MSPAGFHFEGFLHYLAVNRPDISVHFDNNHLLFNDGQLSIIMGEQFYTKEQADALFEQWKNYNSGYLM